VKPNLFEYSQYLQNEAAVVLESLDLLSLWQKQCGQPFLVGALAYGLALAPDIDLEIFCSHPTIEAGFDVLKSCAVKPGCLATRFRNEMAGPDQGYYWQVQYQKERGLIWKIDMWSFHMDHPGPTSREMIAPMGQVLNDENKKVILYLKHAILKDPDTQCASIDLYQAVLADGVRSFEELKTWLTTHKPEKINDWRRWLMKPDSKLATGHSKP
jgi:hypothetical protein